MKRVIFDLDGTLLDTLPDIHAVTNRVLAAEGVAPLDAATVRGFVGKGAPNLVARVVESTGLDMDDHPRLLAAFVADYETATALTRPYPGVPETLDALAAAGIRLAVCTNKPEAPSVAVLAATGIRNRFQSVVGGDTLRSTKPNPEMLWAAMEEETASECLYVGDSEIDAETAEAAGVSFALFTEGYRKRPLSEIPHDFRFSDFSELERIALEPRRNRNT